MTPDQPDLSIIAEHVLREVQEGYVLGLGSGRAATAFVRALGARVKAGLSVRGVPASQSTADLAVELGIPLVGLDAVDSIDLAVDGADEVDPDLRMIKGLGGALVREKIVAASARRFVVLVTMEKCVKVLGQRGKLPVEVIPFGMPLVLRKLDALGVPGTPRMRDGRPFVSDNGNHVLDCRVSSIDDPALLDRELQAIPGVVGTGLFLGMADAIYVQVADKVRVLDRAPL